MNYAAYPPRNPQSLTYQLWDRHVGVGWQGHAENPIVLTPEVQSKIMEELRPTINAIEKLQPT
jgi:hypothetical protein